MATPSARKTAPAAAPKAPELLAVLVAQKFLSAEQAEKVRRAQKVNGLTAEQAILQLAVLSDAQIAQALAAHAGLPYVKINPLDLDLDVVTKAIAGPFARRHGMVAIAKNGGRITIAVHDPFAPFPLEDINRVTGLEVDRVVATRSDVEAVNKGFYDLKSSLQHAEKQLSESRIATVDLGQPGIPVQGRDRPRSGGGAGGEGARPHPRLRLRAARLGHPLRAQAQPDAGAAPDRRRAARRARDPQDRLRGGGLAHQAAVGRQPGREATAAGRPHQARAGRPRGGAARSAPCRPRSARRRCCASSTPTSC